MNDPSYPDALPAQTRLHWYAVERVLGQGGFGITYLARDTNLDQRVAIKEYLPVEFATRMTDSTIRSRTDALRDRYRWGLERFLQEARTLARFEHPNIVRVLSVFEHNNTAYMVMRFEEGASLAAVLDRRGTLPEHELLAIVLPILDGLELIHDAGFIHRDIKPENVYLRGNGQPVLLDFGSARQAAGNSHTLTILVAPGYAPFEQYYSDSANQGPWTDIYALGATSYRAIAGRPPLDAVGRSKGILGSTEEAMIPASIIGAGRYTGQLLAAIDHALQFTEKDRPQSIADWRKELPESCGTAGTSSVPLTVASGRPNATAVSRTSPGAPVQPQVQTKAEPPTMARDAGVRARSLASPVGMVSAGVLAGIGVTAAVSYLLWTARPDPAPKTPDFRPPQQQTAGQPADLREAPRSSSSGPESVSLGAAPQPTRDLPPEAPRSPESGLRPRDSTEKLAPPPPTTERKVPAAKERVPQPKPDDASRSASQGKSPSGPRDPPATPPLRAASVAPNANPPGGVSTPPLAPAPSRESDAAPPVLDPAPLPGLPPKRPAEQDGDTRIAEAEKYMALGKQNEAQGNANYAYAYFGCAARLGSPTARVEQDRLAASLQTYERRQADQVSEACATRAGRK